MQLRKSIEAKKVMQYALEMAKFRIVREFGYENSAGDNVRIRLTILLQNGCNSFVIVFGEK